MERTLGTWRLYPYRMTIKEDYKVTNVSAKEESS